MTRLEWGASSRLYEDGVSNAVLYFQGEAHVWNGLIAVDEQTSETQNLSYYFDGQRLVVTEEIGDYRASLQAYTYPDILDEHDGFSKPRTYDRYGLTYRTTTNLGDRIHIVYNAQIRDSERRWSSLTGSIGPSVFRWDISADSIDVPGAKPAARLTIDTTTALPELVALVEGWLYGTATTNPRLPTPQELVDIFEEATLLRITVHPDGSYTASGPDQSVSLDADGYTFHISGPTVTEHDDGVFTASSY